MTKLRFAHISDTHLGYRSHFKTDSATGRNQRSVDVEETYRIAIDDILTRDVQLVIHGGDVFHHTRPTWTALSTFLLQTQRLVNAGLPVLVIGGNHDTPRLRTSGSVFSFLRHALPDVQFVCAYEQEVVPYEDLGLFVHAVPHGALINPVGPMVFPELGMKNVLVTHGLVSGVQLHGRKREPGEEEVSDSLLDEELDYIALGHYHVYDKVRHNAWYSGSTERMGFGDEDVDPGYALVELGSASGAEVTHIPIEARPMKTLAAVDGEGRDAREIADIVLDRAERFSTPETITRIELRETLRHVRREVEAIVRRESAPLVWSLDIFARSDLLIAPGEQRLVSESLDIRSLFEKFVVERAYEPAFSAAFLERGLRALDDAVRAQESAVVDEGAA
jgi:exonuclease SbcD